MNKYRRSSRLNVLDERILFHARNRKLYAAERRDLAMRLQYSPFLAECYEFLQTIYRVYDMRITALKAEYLIRGAWDHLSQEAKATFADFRRVLDLYPKELFAYWTTRRTTSRAEAANRTLSTLKSAARGMKFEEFRRRAIHTRSPTRRIEMAKKANPGSAKTSSHGRHRPGVRARKMIAVQYAFNFYPRE